MSEHLLLGAGDDSDRWVILHRDYANRWNVYSSARTSLEGTVNFLIETMLKHPGADLTFSTRPAAQARVELVEDVAAVRAAVAGASISIMAPMGGQFAPNLWGTAGRDPRGGLSEGHRNTRFRGQVLPELIRLWFVRQNFQSFSPEPLRQRGDQQRVARPGYARELWVRHDWSIADVMAEARPRRPPEPLSETDGRMNADGSDTWMAR